MVEAHATVTQFAKKKDDERAAIIVTLLGLRALDLHDSLPFSSDAEKADLKSTLDYLEDHFVGKTNIIHERFVFNSREQHEGESFPQYLAVLRQQARLCNFQNIDEEQIMRDRLVCGIRDESLRQTMLAKQKLTLEECIMLCRGKEQATSQMATMRTIKQETETDSTGCHATDEMSVFEAKRSSQISQGKEFNRSTFKRVSAACQFCGHQHQRGAANCPAYGKRCGKCGGRNHFAAVCRSRVGRGRLPIRAVDNEDGWNSYVRADEDFDVLTLTLNDHVVGENTEVHGIEQMRQRRSVSTKLQLDNKWVAFQLDTGAACNVLRSDDLPQNAQLKPTNRLLRVYNGETVKPLGCFEGILKNPRTGRTSLQDFYVIEKAAISLLGLFTCQEMKLLTVHYENLSVVQKTQPRMLTKEVLLDQYSDVFSDCLGCIAESVHLEIDESVPPTKLAARRLPLAVRDDVKAELDRLEEMGVITQMSKPTEWISALVVERKKNGKLRLCLDPRPLNKALRRSTYPIPVIDDLLPRLSRAKFFSVCDAKNGYWQLKLDESSIDLTAMATPFGRYAWKRMPFGVSPAPEIFQEKLDRAIEGLEGVFAIFDDILVIGEGDTLEEAESNHDVRFLGLMERSRERKLQFHPDKLRFKLKGVPYVGHELTSCGLKIDEHKVKAIKEMPMPENVREVRRFVGMANFFSRFMPNMATALQPLHQLTAKDAAWVWGPEHNDAVTAVKEALSSAPVLKYFDKELPTVLQCDASAYGLGAVILQDGQPIAYASRRLTKTEEGYAQIERELLAIVFGCRKFDQYAFGRRLCVHTDHQPLATIVKRRLSEAPKRLQRMLLQLQRYDIEVLYLPGKQMFVADALLRAPIDMDPSDKEDEECPEILATEMVSGGISDPTLEKVRNATTQDETMQKLSEAITMGWPDHQHKVCEEIRQFFHHREELTVENGIIFKGDRCVIPAELRMYLLRKLHSPHMGVEATLRQARQLIFWPGMNAQIRDIVARCDVCQAAGRRQPKQPLCSHPIPDRPWQVVGADLFELGTQSYLIMVDYWSGFWELDSLQNTLSKEVTLHMKRQFARHGIPQKVVTDNGPQFSSRHFKQFSNLWQFEHVTSSPYHPISNGKAESAVKTAKHLAMKAQNDGQDPWLAILAYRNTPTEGMSTSPMERLTGRKARTTIPTRPSLLKPKIDESTTTEELMKRQQRQAYYYDQSAHGLPKLIQGDDVRVQPREAGTSWKPAIVVREFSPRSFEVLFENGRTARRNRCQLRKVKPGRNVVYNGNSQQDWAAETVERRNSNSGSQEPRCPERTLAEGRVFTRYGREVKQPDLFRPG